VHLHVLLLPFATALSFGIANHNFYQQLQQLVGGFRGVDFPHGNSHRFFFYFYKLLFFEVGVAPIEKSFFFVGHLQVFEVKCHIRPSVFTSLLVSASPGLFAAFPQDFDGLLV